MATLRPTLAQHGYKNWVKGGLALKFSREGIENFIERNIDQFHQDVMNSLSSGANCSNCSTENIIQCRCNNNFCRFKQNTCKVHDSKDSSKTSRLCPNSVCDIIRDKVLDKHRFHGPSWRNTDSKRWCREPWQLATCFMPPTGYATTNTASDTDITGLLNVVINNKLFDTQITDDMTKDDNIFCKARDARNQILHKADMQLTDTELADCISTLDNMLSDPKHLAGHPDAIKARQLLQQLLNGKLKITEEHETEVLAEAVRAAIEAVNKEKDGAIDDIKSENNEVLTAISKEKDNAQDDIKSDKSEALTAISQEKDNARDDIKSDKSEALTAISKEKDNARDDIKSDKNEALTAISKEKDNAQDDIKSDKNVALTAISQEKDNAQDDIKSDKSEALTAISQEKDNARDDIKSDKNEALTAISKEKDNAQDDIKSDKNVALTAISQEKDNAQDDIKSDKSEALSAISREKHNASRNIDGKTSEAIAAVNKERDDAREVLRLEKDEGETVIKKARFSATTTLKLNKQEAVIIINTKEKQTIAALQDALTEALRIIKEKEDEAAANLQTLSEDSYTKIKKDLKAELLSVYQDNEHLTTPLSPLNPLEDKHIDQLYVTPNMKLVDHRRVQKDEGTPIVTYKDIFEERNKKIYVVGEAGTGKTAFCQEIVSTWCQVNTTETERLEDMSDNQLTMANFDFVFYISLRDETTQNYVEEMIKNSLLPNKPSLQELLSKVFREERCLVVLDGLDEWTTENQTTSSSHINKGLPGRDSIRNCTVITTTRPWKLEVLKLKSSQIDTKVELLGINKTSYEQLAQNMITYLNDTYHRQNTYENFNEEIKEKKLDKLMTIPVILKQIVCLWYLGKDLGKTKTAIYSQAFVLLLELAQTRLEKDAHYLHKKEEWMKSSIKLPPCLDGNETCQQFKPLIIALAKLAFQTLLSNDQESALVFKSTKAGCYDLSQEEVNICLKIGILCQNKILRLVSPLKKISFLHKTYHEFLAAMFVSLDQSNCKHCVEKIQTFCNTESKCYEMSNVLTFVSGTCTSDITCTLVQHFSKHIHGQIGKDREQNIISISSIIVDCMREGWTCSHNNKHLYCDIIVIREPSEYLDQLCKVNIPNLKRFVIWYPPTALCLQYLLQVHTLERLTIARYRTPPLPSEDLVYTLIHHHRHTLTIINIADMTLRSNTRLSTLITQVPHLCLLYMVNTTLPQQLLTSLQALHSPPDMRLDIEDPTILPDTESTD